MLRERGKCDQGWRDVVVSSGRATAASRPVIQSVVMSHVELPGSLLHGSCPQTTDNEQTGKTEEVAQNIAWTVMLRLSYQMMEMMEQCPVN